VKLCGLEQILPHRLACTALEQHVIRHNQGRATRGLKHGADILDEVELPADHLQYCTCISLVPRILLRDVPELVRRCAPRCAAKSAQDGVRRIGRPVSLS
jgi:hypothetical protein